FRGGFAVLVLSVARPDAPVERSRTGLATYYAGAGRRGTARGFVGSRLCRNHVAAAVARLDGGRVEISLHGAAGLRAKNAASGPLGSSGQTLPDRRGFRGDPRLRLQLRFLCRAERVGTKNL